MKYLVLGVNGMAGHVIAQLLIERGNSMVGFARQPGVIAETMIGDAMDRGFRQSVISDQMPDVVVNAIGVLNKALDANMSR